MIASQRYLTKVVNTMLSPKVGEYETKNCALLRSIIHGHRYEGSCAVPSPTLAHDSKKSTKFHTTPTFSLLKRWPYKYWRLPRKKIDGLLNSNGGFLILFLMWNTLKSVYYVKIRLFWMVRSNLRGHNHDMWRNIYMPLLFNVFGAAKMPLRRI